MVNSQRCHALLSQCVASCNASEHAPLVLRDCLRRAHPNTRGHRLVADVVIHALYTALGQLEQHGGRDAAGRVLAGHAAPCHATQHRTIQPRPGRGG